MSEKDLNTFELLKIPEYATGYECVSVPNMPWGFLIEVIFGANYINFWLFRFFFF